ncbi:hypothetical protein QOT19_23170 [Serratia marcescens]|uniref:hypothetical protein n=1 Tax=Serratia marcescens TaxID=615 RepID=UPI002730E91E|nr:hypothetical protein [Serratia marcescens]MDP0522227.1 hypothetical protein [Serratia marcescens]
MNHYPAEYAENINALKNGQGVVLIESWMPDEVIGKLIRRKLEQAEGADITVTYTVITDEMQQAAHNF